MDILKKMRYDYFDYCCDKLTDLEGQTECPTLTFEEFAREYDGYSKENQRDRHRR